MSIGFRHMLDLIEKEVKDNDSFQEVYDNDKLKNLCHQIYLIASSSDAVVAAQQNEIKSKIEHNYDLIVDKDELS
ncbi:hypothetical protein JKP31_22555 [Vibrio vulnificus]|uniref:hypothetical protein n=1 Tax=Vibrio vulnificus TaxID=672 RepID=UPI001CDC13BD|nr:hypothetical protein [Vibrio vulnificus]MCA3904030.1 hypothetical protein [Vibrio vulnificus]